MADSELPRIVAVWIGSLDGRSTLDGRSSGLSNAADRTLFLGLRAQADAILVGSRTLAIERYRRPGRNPRMRERRAALGLAEEPAVLVVSRELSLPLDIPLLQDPESRVQILTWSDAEPPPVPARVGVIRLPRGDRELRGALVAARAAGIRSVLCEGGPTLLGLLIAEDLLDELVVTIAPMFVGAGEQPVVDGLAHPPRRYRLGALDREDDYVFARYARAREPS